MTYKTTISKVISDLILQNDLHPNDELKLSSFAIDAMRELNNDSLPIIQEGRFELPSSRIIKLPNDWMDYHKIGILYQQGVKALSINKYMSTSVSLDGTQSIYTVPPLSAGPRTTIGYFDYGFGGGKNEGFGTGGHIGDFTINYKDRIIRFADNVPAGPVFMAWLSDCQNMNADTVVHPYCVQWVKTFCLLEIYIRMRDTTMIAIYKEKEEIERRAMRRRIMEQGPQDFINVYEQQFGAYE